MGSSILIYVFILVAKIIEVSLSTIRIVLITKGERAIGAAIGFVEVLMWVFIASSVIKDIASDPLKGVIYALGFALGNYFGSKIEERIGLGLSELQIIVKEEHGHALAEKLRLDDLAVTLIRGEGKNFDRYILLMFVPRKRVHEVIRQIREIQENAVITVSETKPIYGGYGMIGRR